MRYTSPDKPAGPCTTLTSAPAPGAVEARWMGRGRFGFLIHFTFMLASALGGATGGLLIGAGLGVLETWGDGLICVLDASLLAVFMGPLLATWLEIVDSQMRAVTVTAFSWALGLLASAPVLLYLWTLRHAARSVVP